MTESSPVPPFPDGDLPEGAKWVLRTSPSPRQHMSYWFVGTVVASLIPFLPDIVHWVDGSYTFCNHTRRHSKAHMKSSVNYETATVESPTAA